MWARGGSSRTVQGVASATLRSAPPPTLALPVTRGNLDDGRVEVYATGRGKGFATGTLLSRVRLRDVREVEEQEAALQQYRSFEISDASVG